MERKVTESLADVREPQSGKLTGCRNYPPAHSGMIVSFFIYQNDSPVILSLQQTQPVTGKNQGTHNQATGANPLIIISKSINHPVFFRKNFIGLTAKHFNRIDIECNRMNSVKIRRTVHIVFCTDTGINLSPCRNRLLQCFG